MKFLTGILALSGITVLLHAAEVKPVLHASFDKDFRAVTGKGIVDGKHSSKITMETLSMLLQKGVRGKAAKIGVQSARGTDEVYCIHYPGSVLNVKQGTISFWLKPLDWDFKDAKFHIFCEAYGPKSWLLIYKYGDSHNLYFLFGRTGNHRGTDWVIAEASASKWERGTARLITATWDKNNVRLYMDGLLQVTEKVGAMPQKFNVFSAGPRSANAWKNHTGESLMDDLRIYDRPLTGAEVEELFASYGVKAIDKSKIPVKISLIKMLSSQDGSKLNLNFNLTRTMKKRTGFSVEMQVVKDGKTTVLKKVLKSDATEYHYEFKVANLAKGEYRIFLRPIRELPTDKIENSTYLFTIGSANPYVDHSVPSPWEPLVLKSVNGTQTITAKMQKTVFEKSVLPTQLYSQEQALLRAPVQFLCNGISVKGCTAEKTLEQKPDQITLENTIRGNAFDLSVRSRMEFDGMMWFEVTLSPKKKLPVNSAKIIVPLRPEVSTLFNCFAKDYYNFRGFNAGELKTSVKRNHYRQEDLPVLWMGNEQRGLYYFSQDQAGRRLKNRAETIRLDPGKNGAQLTINLIDYASVLEKPVTWRFGLQVTPVRPFVRNRLLWRPESSIALWFPWSVRHNLPDARFKMQNYHKIRNAWSGNGEIPLFHYFAGFSASPDNPGFPQNAYDWSVTPPIVGTEVSPDNRQWCYIFVCPHSRSYRDTYLHDMKKCIRDLKMQYLYFDNSWSWFCTNEKHGCGWRDEFGKLYPSANILGSRELAKNIYRIHRNEYPYGLIVRHISQIPEPPLVAFCDAIVDGECFMMNVGRDENYYSVFRPDYFRASFIGVQFGMPSMYIAQFNRAYSEHFPEKLPLAKAGKLKNQTKHLRHFTGYAFVHDTDTWPNFGIKPLVQKIWKIMEKAGIRDNTEFYGYWMKRNPVKKISPLTDRVMVSSYAAENGVLTFVMNDTDASVKVKLQPDVRRFGNSPKLTDAESGVVIKGTTAEVPARDFRIIQIQK